MMRTRAALAGSRRAKMWASRGALQKVLAAAASLVLSVFACERIGAAQADFITLHYVERQEFTIRCVIDLYCDLQLEPGERVNDGFNAQKGEWDPHMAYTGGGQTPLPHLILRPSANAHRTNIILTTTRRTYYLLLLPVKSSTPLYYSFQYDSTTYRNLANLAVATQTALRDQYGPPGAHPSPAPTPVDVADIGTVCFDYNYTYTVDRYLPDDHPHNAKPSDDPFPGEWKPKTVCSDGQHTFVQLTPQRQLPVDLPVAFALTAEGDTMINSTFNANRWRYTIDGVYTDVVLELGSQYRPLRLHLHHPDPYGTVPEGKGKHQHDPLPVNSPAAPTGALLRAPMQSGSAVPSPGPTPSPMIVNGGSQQNDKGAQ